MAWLYLPPDALTQTVAGEACADFPSAPGLVDLTSVSISPSPDIELFVMSNGKHTPRPLSWRGWKMKPWIARLSGTTLAPSTAKHGVASWISSMAAIPASPSASPEKNSATKTRAISGHTSPVSCARSNRRSASSKMSADIYDWGSNKSMMTFDKWVIALRQACLQRRKSAHPTDANACSSWPTATATDATVNSARPPHKMIRKDGRNVLRTPSLAETVMQPPDFPYTKQDLELQKNNLPYAKAKAHWLTPRAQESNESQATFLARNDDRTDRCFNSLTGQAALWPTATATDGEKGGPNSRHGSGSLHLPAAAVQTQWYTPNVPNGGRKNPPGMSATGKLPNGKKRQVALENQALQIWPTPMANPNTNRQTKPTPSQLKGEHGLNLAMVAVQSSWPTPRTCAGKRSSGSNRTELVNSWATPTTRDWKDGTPTANVETNCLLGRQAPRSMRDGRASPLTLNPLFVEWLMGWPIGWTDCVSAATGLSRWLQLMRSELSRLLLASTDEQLDLFA